MRSRVVPSLLVAAAVTAGSGLAALPADASSSSHARITDCAGKARTRPHTYVLACGDGGAVLQHLTWRRFGRSTSSATGTLTRNTCDPNCAEGGRTNRRVRVVASKPRNGRYTSLRVSSASSGRTILRFRIDGKGPVSR